MAASKSQFVEYQISTARYLLAAITRIVSGDTVNLLAFTDDEAPVDPDDLPAGTTFARFTDVAKGSAVGEWRDLALPADTTALLDGKLSVPAAAEAVVLAIDTFRAPSTVREDDRPTLVTAVVSWSIIESGEAAMLEVIVGAGGAPTAIAFSVPFTFDDATVGAIDVQIPAVISFLVPAGHAYKLKTGAGGGGTFAVASIAEHAL
jgi:hypothetical protein